jgi:DNA gyrase subunit B
MTDFDRKTLEHRLRELAFLNSGVHIILATSVRPSLTRSTSCTRAASAFVEYLDKAKQADPGAGHAIGEKDGITVEVALWWNDSYHENVLCFTNNIPQRDGGTHLAGFRGALTRGSSTTTPTSFAASRRRKRVAVRRRCPRRA